VSEGAPRRRRRRATPLFDRSRLLGLLVVAFAGGVAGYAYVALAYPPGNGNVGSRELGFAIGAAIGTLITIFEIVFVNDPDSVLRRLPMLPALAIRVAVQFLIISVSIAVFQIAYERLYGTAILSLSPAGIGSHFKDVSFSLIVSALIVFYLQMRMYIGPGTLARLMLGSYNRPRQEERIFMILDIPATTSAAQAIGDTAFHRYLNHLFVLFDQPIVAAGGEVHSYVGDSIIAVWPLSGDVARNSRVLEALSRIVACCRDEADDTEARFGIRPGVRAAINGGPVVIGESGASHRQITYLGDVMNIASRIEQKTKDLDKPLLIASALLGRMRLPAGMTATPVGEHALKGARSLVALTELRVA